MNVSFETGCDGSTATTHDWLTPPELLQALGAFDMDPCASQYQPRRPVRNLDDLAQLILESRG